MMTRDDDTFVQPPIYVAPPLAFESVAVECVFVFYAVRRMMCRPESESTTPDISPTCSAIVPSCKEREKERGRSSG
jgi:hypothetical protein